jgi:hypothetical protein
MKIVLAILIVVVVCLGLVYLVDRLLFGLIGLTVPSGVRLFLDIGIPIAVIAGLIAAFKKQRP